MPHRLEILRREATARPSAGFWFTNAYLHRFGRVIGTLFNPRRPIPEGRVPGHFAVGDRYLPYVTTTVMIRREAFERTGFFREDLKILEDTELYGRMLSQGLEVGVVREPLAVRFLHEGQITRDYRRDFAEALEALKNSGAPPDMQNSARARLAREIAEYLWRDLKPLEARRFLLEEFGNRAKTFPLYLKTFLPESLLARAKGLRMAYLRFRHHPALASSEVQEACRTIDSCYSDLWVSDGRGVDAG